MKTTDFSSGSPNAADDGDRAQPNLNGGPKVIYGSVLTFCSSSAVGRHNYHPNKKNLAQMISETSQNWASRVDHARFEDPSSNIPPELFESLKFTF
jgi:hypothetical protein